MRDMDLQVEPKGERGRTDEVPMVVSQSARNLSVFFRQDKRLCCWASFRGTMPRPH